MICTPRLRLEVKSKIAVAVVWSRTRVSLVAFSQKTKKVSEKLHARTHNKQKVTRDDENVHT